MRSQLRIAYQAALQSPDPSTQNGAALYLGDRFITTGHNHPVVPMRPEFKERNLKLIYFEHAERDAIFRAARHGVSLEGATMYCPFACCHECARAIVLAGIKTVVVHKDLMDISPERWRTSIKIGHDMLQDNRVEIQEFSGSVDSKIKILFDGKDWST